MTEPIRNTFKLPRHEELERQNIAHCRAIFNVIATRLANRQDIKVDGSFLETRVSSQPDSETGVLIVRHGDGFAECFIAVANNNVIKMEMDFEWMIPSDRELVSIEGRVNEANRINVTTPWVDDCLALARIFERAMPHADRMNRQYNPATPGRFCMWRSVILDEFCQLGSRRIQEIGLEYS